MREKNYPARASAAGFFVRTELQKRPIIVDFLPIYMYKILYMTSSNFVPLARWAAILPVITVLTACTVDSTSSDTTEEAGVPVHVEAVRPGLRRDFSVTGEVTAEKSATITSDFRADITEVRVQPGDAVRRGQELVTMQSANVKARYSTANTSYVTAAQNLEQTKITNRKNVESAKAAMETAETNLQTLLVQNQARRTQAEETLASAGVNLTLSVASAQTALDNAVRSARVTAEQALFEADQIVELSNDRDDLSTVKERHIGVLDPTFHSQVEIALYGGYASLKQSSDTYDSMSLLLEEVEVVMEMVLRTLQNSVTSVEYPESAHDANVRDVTGQLTSVRSMISSLQTAQRNIETAQKQNGGSDSQVMIDAQANYQVTIAEIDAAEVNARRQVEQAKIAYETAIASSSVAEIGARSTLASVAGELTQARVENDKLTILAPFDGVVVDVPVREGEEVAVGDVLTIVENDAVLKIVAYLSPDEARGVKAGDSVLLDNSIVANISAVAPSADPITKKYKVEIQNDTDVLQPGEFVRITFSAQGAIGDERIFLPISAVHIKASETFVWTVTQSGSHLLANKTPVRLGELAGEYVEVRTGVQQGQRVVLQGGRLIQDSGTVLTDSQNF